MTVTRSGDRVRIVLVVVAMGLLGAAPPAIAWGPAGHRRVTEAAVMAAPDLPGWFRDAEALSALSSAPDRWRGFERTVPALVAWGPDHYFDLDDWGRAPLPRDRWAFVAAAARRKVRPERIGFLPWAILEQYGRLVSAFRDARMERPGSRADAIATAGILAHFVGDLAVPLHATRHHHGWVGANPRGFTRSQAVHHWFESELVARLGRTPIRVGEAAARPVRDPWRAVLGSLATSLAAVPRLYELERDQVAPRSREALRAFVIGRLEAGAALLAGLWRAAWRAGAS